MNSPSATSLRRAPILWGTTIGLIALAYVVLLGGTAIAEVLPSLRTVNALIAAALLVRYLLRLPAGGDALDRWVLIAIILFTAAGALSSMPRQSLDAVLLAATCGAALFTARDLLVSERARRMFITVMMALSLVLTVVVAGGWLQLVWQWWTLAGGDVLPPFNLELNSWPWGHRYDLAFLIAILYPAWWVGGSSLLRRVMATAVGLPVVAVMVLVGSRTLWAAFGLATLVVATPIVLRTWHQSTRMRWAILGLVGAVVVTVVVAGLAGAVIQRALSGATIDYRTAMWGSLLEVWADHPIAGYGPGTFTWLLQLTDYFNTNSWAPLHPDSALFQLLGEAGGLGLAAGVIVVGSVVPAVLRSRSAAASWVAIAFLVMSLGANPTVFLFLLGIAIAWIAYAVPHAAGNSEAGRVQAFRPHRLVRMASFGAVAVIGAGYLATLGASFAYNSAVFAVRDGELAKAAADLDTAVTLDPGMALYWRQRGELAYVDGQAPKAVSDLTRATQLNPSDDLTWRALGLAYDAANNELGALSAFDEALFRQRSDPTNVLLKARWLDSHGDSDGSSTLLAETVQSWPQIVGAPGWATMLPTGVTTADVVDAAAHRWELGSRTRDIENDEGLWLTALSRGSNIRAAAIAAAPVSPILAEAELGLVQCDLDNQLQASSAADRRSGAYWTLRFWDSHLRGGPDDTAAEMVRIMTGNLSFPGNPDFTLNPLDENGQFSADLWGYRRLPISWPTTDAGLPSPDAGALRWLVDARGAARASGLAERVPACR
jgi:O-antigen ligase/tetratricopeptide (TPR) repeat protein